MVLPFNFDSLNSVNDPWGPQTINTEKLAFNNVPYTPFLKTDRLGKIADHYSIVDEQSQANATTAAKPKKDRDQFYAYGSSSAAKMFGIDLDNQAFSLVDTNFSNANNTVLKTKKQGAQSKPQGFAAAVAGTPSSSEPAKKQSQQVQNSAANGANGRWFKEPAFKREPSTKVESNWNKVNEFELNKLSKLSVVVSNSEVIAQAGELHQYTKKYDTPKPTQLAPSSLSTEFQTTSDDSIIKSLAAEGKAKIFITDEILAQIMCAPKSQFSWDIKVTKKDGSIFFDKRPNTMRMEVDENTFNGPNDSKPSELNSSTMLSKEAKLINDTFLATSISSAASVKHELDSAVNESIKRNYNYIKFDLPHSGEDTIPIVVRTVQDATVNGKPIAIHALNQYESSEWLTKFQAGLIMVDEIKKNNNKISQWTCRALLAQCESMKVGFVTRQPNSKYTVAAVTTQMTSHLAEQINLSLNNGWGIVKSIIDIIQHEGDADENWEFVLFKVPNVQRLAIYKVEV